MKDEEIARALQVGTATVERVRSVHTKPEAPASRYATLPH